MTVLTPIRIATVLGAVALLAGLLETTAAATPPVRTPDSQETAASGDRWMRVVVEKSGEIDPALAAAIAAHRASMTAADKRSPDTRDAAAQSIDLDPAIRAAIAAHRVAVTAADRRSPDATVGGGVPTSTSQLSVVAGGSVFDWTDAAIGAVAGFAIALLLGGVILLSTRGRHERLAV